MTIPPMPHRFDFFLPTSMLFDAEGYDIAIGAWSGQVRSRVKELEEARDDWKARHDCLLGRDLT